MRRARCALWIGLGLAVLTAQGCSRDAPAESARADEQPTRDETRASQRVRVAEVRSGSLGGFSNVAGITSAFRTATVAAEVNARVVERHVEPGQAVAEGDALVSLDNTFLAIAVDEALATLEARETDLAEATRELERGDELAHRDAISDGQHDGLRFARDRAESQRNLAKAALNRAWRTRADATVRAPFAGTIEQIDVQVGDYLAPGTPVAVVADFHKVRLRAGVTANEAADLEPGTPAMISIPALGDFQTQAAIHSVGQMADATTGTYPVELWLENPDLRIRGGMVGQLRLSGSSQVAAAVVPRAAILRRDGRMAVYVVEEGGGQLHARARTVKVGRQQGDQVELLSGVQVGDRVVIEGLFALSDGAAVFVDESPQREPEATAWND
jgi:RND family efflux transporter MFP subunit